MPNSEQRTALLNSGEATLAPIDRDEDGYGRKLRIVKVDGQSVGDTKQKRASVEMTANIGRRVGAAEPVQLHGFTP